MFRNGKRLSDRATIALNAISVLVWADLQDIRDHTGFLDADLLDAVDELKRHALLDEEVVQGHGAVYAVAA